MTLPFANVHVLVIAAHPDDEILGAGGFLATHPGCSVAVVSEGTSAEAPRAGRSYEDFLGAKRWATKRATTELNAVVVREGDFLDQQLHLIGPALHQWIESVLIEARPEVVLTHAPEELNRDHRVVAEAVAVACRPYCASGRTVDWLLGFHVDAHSQPGQAWTPQLVLGLSEGELEMKADALRPYEAAGAMRAWPHPRSREAIIATARALGSRWGLQAAEGYSLVWGRM